MRTTPPGDLRKDALRGLESARKLLASHDERERVHIDIERYRDLVLVASVLADEINRIHRRIPRCGQRTATGYRCAQGQGHSGPHTHPNESEEARVGAERAMFDA